VTMTSTDSLDVRAKARRASRRRRVAYIIYLTLGMLLFFLVWEWLASPISPLLFLMDDPQTFMPRPWNTITHFVQNLLFSEGLQSRYITQACPEYASERIADIPDICFGYALHLLETTKNILIGAALGTIFGLSMGLGSLVFPKIAQVVTPVASFFGTAPIFIAAPFFVIWFGIEIPLLTTIGLITFYTTLLMYFFSRRAAENIPVGIVESALTLGGTPRSIFRWVYLKGTVPEIAGGFRIALAGAWGLGALVEVLGPQLGGGFLIRIWSFLMGTQGAAEALVSLTVFLGVLAVVVDGLLVLGIRFITRWSESGRRLGL